MKKQTITIAITCLVLFSFRVLAKDKSPKPATDTTPEQIEASYTQSLEKRVAEILTELDLKDSEKQGRVHEILMAQYRSLRAVHDVRDTKVLAKSPTTSPASAATTAPTTFPTSKPDYSGQLKALHQKFLEKLSTELSPAQIVTVKDKMTYNKVQVTYKGYLEIVQNLSEVEKAKIMEILIDAREEAMDGGSADEKSVIFKKYKGKVVNYLSGNGHDVTADYKAWGERQKAAKPVEN